MATASSLNGPRPLLDTYQAIVSAFSEFLTVAVHTLLYERDIYPRTSFLNARKYNFPVRQSRHPKVCSWIADAISAVEAQLLKAAVSQTSLIIYSPASIPLERFIFSTANFPTVPQSDIHTPFESDHLPPTPLIDLASQFRGVLSRLCTQTAALGPLPPGCTFTIAIELRDRPLGQAPIGWPQPWVPAVPGLQRGGELGGAKTTPVRSVEAGPFVMEVWVEEGRGKLVEASSTGSSTVGRQGSSAGGSSIPVSRQRSSPGVSVEDAGESFDRV